MSKRSIEEISADEAKTVRRLPDPVVQALALRYVKKMSEFVELMAAIDQAVTGEYHGEAQAAVRNRLIEAKANLLARGKA